jgi:hypothetical protein
MVRHHPVPADGVSPPLDRNVNTSVADRFCEVLLETEGRKRGVICNPLATTALIAEIGIKQRTPRSRYFIWREILVIRIVFSVVYQAWRSQLTLAT